MAKGNCEFKGTGGQYFVAVIIHLFVLGILTLGIYTAWAWVRVLRLKATHTIVNGEQVSFTGTGGQLFVLMLVNILLTIITLGLYGPWALSRYFNWRARYTLVGEKPSQFTGTGSGLFLFYLIHLIILPLVTLGIYYFFGLYRLYAWKEEHTKYGGERTTFGAGFGGFIKVSLLGWILNLITLQLATPWVLCMFYRWQINGLAVGDGAEVQHFPPVKTNPAIVIILILIGLIPFALLFFFVKDQFDRQMKEFGKMPRIEAPKKTDLTSAKESIKPIEKKIRPELKIPETAKEIMPEPPPKKKTEKTSIDYDAEITKLDLLIMKASDNAVAYYNRAWLYAVKGNNGKALEDYSRAVEIDKKFEDAYYNRGSLHANLGQYDEAVKDFDVVIQLNEGAVDAYCNRGSANYEMGKPDLAIEDFTKAITLKGDDPDLYYNRALAYLAKGQKSLAKVDFQKAVGLGSDAAQKHLKVKPTKKPKPATAPKDPGAGWRMDLKGVPIPSSYASGMIRGEQFKVDKGLLENGILTLRQGKDFFPDRAVMIFLFLKEGETADKKSFFVTETSGFGSPHIHMKWKPEDKDVPETEVFMDKYAMRLEFDQASQGMIPGRIYLCLPDDEKSYVVGSFAAAVK